MPQALNALELQHRALAHQEQYTDSQKRQLAAYRKLKFDAEQRGYKPASVISMHAFGWPVTGPVYPTNIDIPGVPLSKEHWLAAPKISLPNKLEVPYVQHIFTEWMPSHFEYYVGELDPTLETGSGHIWPIDQARDAVDQNGKSADRGGVFCYEGAHRPGSLKETSTWELTEFSKAHAKLIRYYQTQHQKYLDAWSSRQSTNAWKDLAGKGNYHRWMATYLFNIGLLEQLPVYCQEYVSPEDRKKPKCDQCQQNVEPGAILCRHCGRVLNPFEAFDKYMIDAETPGAKLAAKRLSDSEIGLLMKSGRLEQEQLAEWGIITLTEKKKGKNAGAADDRN